jgi:CBS domain-containing protein
MRAELAEIAEFIGECPPFSLLDATSLAELPRRMAIRYLRRGSPFPPAEEATPHYWLLRKGAVELRDAAGRLVSQLAEGDAFDAPCFAGAAPLAGTAIEDCLAYLLPCTEIQALRRAHPAVDAHFTRSLAVALRHARGVAADDTGIASVFGEGAHSRLLSLRVADFVRRAPVTIGGGETIHAAARRMHEAAVSALLVVDDGRLTGIVTDRDLRSRCLAEALPGTAPVAAIMTPAPQTIAPEAAAFEALLLMTQRGIHHLPVVDAGGPRGMITSTDLLRWQGRQPIYLAAQLRQATGLDELVRASGGLAELQVAMHGAGATASQVGQALSSLNDVITRRLLDFAEAALGPPPVRYAWLACGSQGRHEQTVHSDQDNALILHDDFRAEVHGDYFTALARQVCDGLDLCGYRYCPGEVMAANPQWRMTQSAWLETFRGWLARTDRKAAMLVANFADLRVVAGDATLFAPLPAAIAAGAARHEGFLAQMVGNTLDNRPPLGLFRKLVLIADGEHAHTLDCKRRGLLPIADIARIDALARGVGAVGTLARLHAAADPTATGAAAGVLSPAAAAELAESFEFLAGLRLRHQAEQLRRGEAPDNFIDPDTLTPLERRHLKDVFAVISRLQDTLRQRHPEHPRR